MKAEVLSPPRAKDAKELENVLNEWKFKYAEVQKYDPKFTLAEDTRKTLLMKVIPRDFVKIMREQFDRHDTYDDLEHQLLTEIATRQMEEEHYGKGKAIQAVVEPQPVTHQDHAYDHEYYYYYDSNCDQWIGALAPKRDREEVDGDEDRAKRPREDNDKGKSKGKGKKGARPRAPGPCWTCGGPHQQWQCPEKGSGKGPLPTAWTAWRPSAFPGPSATQWRSWMPRFSPKGNGESKGKGKCGKKGSKGDGGKGVGAVWWNYPGHSVLGHLAHEHEEYGQGCQDQWQDAGCVAQSQFRPICAVLRSPIGIQNTFKILESDEADAGKEGKEEERGAYDQTNAISWPKICSGEKRRSKMKMSKAPKKMKFEKKSAIGSSNLIQPNTQKRGGMLDFFCKKLESLEKISAKSVSPENHTLMRYKNDDDMMHQACEDDELMLKSKLLNPKSMIESEEAQNKVWLDANKSQERRRRRTRICGGSCCKDHDDATEESADETRTKAKTLSGLYALTVQQRVEAIREALKVELELNDAEKGANIEKGRVLTPQKPVNVVSKQKSQDIGGWQLLSIIIDSGAAETVIPYKQIKGYKVQETEDSKEGRCYTSATGDPIPNMGEQVLPLQTLEGTLRSMRFQAAPVERPL